MPETNELGVKLGLFFGYGYYSLLRKSFSVAVPFMRTSLGLSKTDVGNIATSFSVAYGLSKFLGGVGSDYFPPDALFAVGLFLAGLSNFVFSMSTNMTSLCVMWFLNGMVQGLGWPALSQIVTNNVHPSRAGTTWSILISGGNLGYLLGPFLLLPLTKFGWKMPFRICGTIGMLLSCLVYLVLSACSHNGGRGIISTESSLGKKDNTKREKTDSTETSDPIIKNGSSPNSVNVVLERVLRDNEKLNEKNNFRVDVKKDSKSRALLKCTRSVNLWLLMIVGGLTTFVLKSMADWTGLFLIEYCGLSISYSTELMIWNEIGGMVGTLLCGVLSDFLGGRKYLTLSIFVAICVPAIAFFPTNAALQNASSTTENFLGFGALYNVILQDGISTKFTILLISETRLLYRALLEKFSGSLGLSRICLFFMGFGINGPKTLLGVMVRDLVPREVSGTIGGIFGLVGQLGASASGVGLGFVLEVYGWQTFMSFLFYGIIAMAVCLIVPVVTLNSSHEKTFKTKDD